MRTRGRAPGSLVTVNRASLSLGAPPFATARLRLGYSLRVDLRSGTEWVAYYSGEYNTRLIAAVQRLLQRPGWVAVDAGANVGFWTIPLAQQAARSHGFVVAVEPVPANAARLREQLALNRVDTAVEVVQLALSDACGEAMMALRDDFRAGALTGNASLRIDDGEDAAFEGLCVQTATLDSVVHRMGDPRVDLIKADVEGHEDRLLAGAQRKLERWRPIVIAEWNRIYYERRGVDPHRHDRLAAG